MPNDSLGVDGSAFSLEEIQAVAFGHLQPSLTDDARMRVNHSRSVVEQLLIEKKIVYGVNTGFGKLSDVHIADHDLDELQVNLARSHAAGLGRPLSEPETRALMLLRANVLATSHSGCRPIV